MKRRCRQPIPSMPPFRNAPLSHAHPRRTEASSSAISFVAERPWHKPRKCGRAESWLHVSGLEVQRGTLPPGCGFLAGLPRRFVAVREWGGVVEGILGQAGTRMPEHD